VCPVQLLIRDVRSEGRPWYWYPELFFDGPGTCLALALESDSMAVLASPVPTGSCLRAFERLWRIEPDKRAGLH
jgi:hypothetical protein